MRDVAAALPQANAPVAPHLAHATQPAAVHPAAQRPVDPMARTAFQPPAQPYAASQPVPYPSGRVAAGSQQPTYPQAPPAYVQQVQQPLAQEPMTMPVQAPAMQPHGMQGMPQQAMNMAPAAMGQPTLVQTGFQAPMHVSQPAPPQGTPLQLASRTPSAPRAAAPRNDGASRTVRQPASAKAPRSAPASLEGSRFRPRAARPEPRPTPVGQTSTSRLYTGIFVALALAVGAVLTRVIFSFF